MKFNRITLGMFVFGISASFMLAGAQVGKSENNGSKPGPTTVTMSASSAAAAASA